MGQGNLQRMGTPAVAAMLDLAAALRSSAAMSRASVAVAIGLAGFITYVALATALADHVIGRHWAVEIVYFVLTGLLWVWPMKRLMYWAARKG